MRCAPPFLKPGRGVRVDAACIAGTCQDMGFRCTHGDRACNDPRLKQLTLDWARNMAALRKATLDAGKFAWQMLW